MKSIEDAIRIRREVFGAFERAEMTDDPVERRRLMTIVVILLVNDVFYRFNEFANNHYQTKAMKEIGDECFATLNRHSYRFFSNRFTGSLVRKANRLVRSFDLRIPISF